MEAVSICRKIINKVSNVAKRDAVQRQSIVSKPDTIEISRKPKLSKLEKIKNKLRSYLTHLDKKSIMELEKCPIDEFFVKAQKLIIDSYNIPLELAAPMQILPNINKRAGMVYNFTENAIYVNPELLKKSRYQLFSFMKHEYTHQKQNYQVLRTEGLGDLAVRKYAQIKSNAGADSFINQYANISKEELEASKEQLGNVYQWVLELKEAVKQGPEAINKFKQKIIDNDYKIYKEQLDSLREKVVQEFGVIPADSKEAELSNEYFNGFMNLYNNPLNILANLKSIAELEAYGVQTLASYEYMLHKFV